MMNCILVNLFAEKSKENFVLGGAGFDLIACLTLVFIAGSVK